MTMISSWEPASEYQPVKKESKTCQRDGLTRFSWWLEGCGGVSVEAFWKTKVLPEETLGVAEVREDRRRSVDEL